MRDNWEIPKHEVDELKEKSHKYCLCIPVINEGERIVSQLKKIDHEKINESIDVIICDGGSTDGSLERSILEDAGVTTLLTKKDKGKLSAQLRMGYSYAMGKGYEGIVTIDGNGKDDVKGVLNFIKALDDGYDMIQGSRYVEGGQAINTPKIRHIAVKMIHIPITNIGAGFKYTDTTNGFRGYSKKLIMDERVQPFRNVFDTYELLAYLSVRAPRLGFKTIEVPVTRKYPNDGHVPTKISFFKGNWLLIKILFSAVFGLYNPKKIDE
ncbi:MAG: glycosyltransferase family 2 protein [Eubacteriales bacterium]